MHATDLYELIPVWTKAHTIFTEITPILTLTFMMENPSAISLQKAVLLTGFFSNSVLTYSFHLFDYP